MRITKVPNKAENNEKIEYMHRFYKRYVIHVSNWFYNKLKQKKILLNLAAIDMHSRL